MSREEILLSALASDASVDDIKPRARKEIMLAYLCGCDGVTEADIPEPRTREEMYLYDMCCNGIGGGGDDDGGDASTLTKLIEGTVPVDLVNNQVIAVRLRAFYACPNLRSVDLPVATSIGNYAFEECRALTTANMPAVTSTGNNAFNKCSSLTTANFPAVTSIANFAFSSCSVLTIADFTVATSIGTYAFYSCSALTTLILRNTAKVATLSNTSALDDTPIKSGTGYIYVPKSLLSDTDASKDYRRATNWSTYAAAQFRALEDYTVDGTVTGELDPNKI